MVTKKWNPNISANVQIILDELLADVMFLKLLALIFFKILYKEERGDNDCGIIHK